jgi:hypothetical protein
VTGHKSALIAAHGFVAVKYGFIRLPHTPPPPSPHLLRLSPALSGLLENGEIQCSSSDMSNVGISLADQFTWMNDKLSLIRVDRLFRWSSLSPRSSVTEAFFPLFVVAMAEIAVVALSRHGCD